MEYSYIKNKLGIYLYPEDITTINGIQFYVNSISHDGLLTKFRCIDYKLYGIYIYKK